MPPSPEVPKLGHQTFIDKKFEGTADAGKAWFADNSRGSEAGLSI